MGGELQFYMTYIDKASPLKEYTFRLAVNAENVYTVSKCEPPVENLAYMVNKLNARNDLNTFICEIRKEFQKAAASSRII